MALEELKFENPQAWDDTSEFSGMGNFGKPDKPGYSTEDMQKTMDEVPRYIAAKINEIIDCLVDGGGGEIHIEPIAGIPDTDLQSVLEWLKEHGSGVSIPAGTTAPSGGTSGDYYFQYSTT